MAKLRHVRVTFAEACEFVARLHRHHEPPRGHRFSLGAVLDGQLVGVAMVGRPVARMLDPETVCELNRLCTDGTRNAASFLLGAARAATFALGFERLITYTLAQEGGASLRAAGYRCLGERGGGSWSRSGRERVDTHPLQPKLLWEAA